MDWGIIISIVILSGLLIIGIVINLWTRFAVMCLIGILIAGTFAYVVWVIISVVRFSVL
jgi:hypothetical protein